MNEDRIIIKWELEHVNDITEGGPWNVIMTNSDSKYSLEAIMGALGDDVVYIQLVFTFTGDTEDEHDRL